MDHRPSHSHSTSTPPILLSRSLTTNLHPTSPSSPHPEPRSDYLRRAIRERKHQRSRLSVPLIERAPTRSSTPDSFDAQAMRLEDDLLSDAWTREASAPTSTSHFSTPRKTHPRRSSTTSTTKPRGTPTLETSHALSTLEKTNFDLRLRVTLQEERAKKLELELQSALLSIKDLADANEAFERRKEERDERVADLERENKGLVADNTEMFALYDELVSDLECKDGAIGEAAEMVCEVEDKKDALEIELAAAHDKIRKLQQEVSKWMALAESVPKAKDAEYSDTDASRLSKQRSRSIVMAPIPTPRPPSSRQSDYFSAESTTNHSTHNPSPQRSDTRGIKGRLQNLKHSMKSRRTQRVSELRAKISYSTLDLTNDSFISQAATETDGDASQEDLVQIIRAPIPSTDVAAMDPTDVSSLAYPSRRRDSVPNWALRHLYLDGEHVGGLAQLPLIRSPAEESTATARTSQSQTAPRPSPIQRSSTSCGFRSPTASAPLNKEPRRVSRNRPELTRLTTTIPASTSTAGTGLLDRTTAWLGSLPKPGSDTPRDMIFNRNAEEFGTPKRDATRRVLWP